MSESSPRVVAVPLGASRTLSPMQRALWASQLSQPDAPLQNMPLLSHLRGTIDPARLVDAFDAVVRGSDVLRTRLTGRDPQTGRWTIQLMELDQIPTTEIVTVALDQVLDWATQRSRTPIDMAHCGFDSAIALHEDGTLSWYLGLHHVITDATSSALVFEATAARFTNEIDQAVDSASGESSSYYSWSRRLVTKLERPADKMTRRSVEHWRDRQPAPRVGRLYTAVETPSAEASRWPLHVGPDLLRRATERLETDYRMLTTDLGWSTLLITTTALYCHRLTGADRFSIGMPVHNRSQRDARALIGPTMEVFPVDIAIEATDSFRSLQARVGRSILQTLRHAAPGTAPTPDFEAVVNVIPEPKQLSFGSIPVDTRWIHSGAIEPTNLLRVQMTGYTSESDSGHGDDSPAAPTFALELNHGASELAHRQRAAGHFETILSDLVAHPDRSIGEHSLCGPDELRQLAAWEHGPDIVGSTPLVVEHLHDVLAGSSAPVLGSAGSSTPPLRGDELWDWIATCAKLLGDRGVDAGDRVAVELPRSVESVVAIMAVLTCGASFVPIDPAQPERRRNRLIERAECVLTLDSVADIVAARTHERASFTPVERSGDDEAYLLFTSGSTGEPKGVPITHGGLATYLRFAAENYTATDAAGQPTRLIAPLFSALTFDLTITSLFVPILTGGTLLVVADDGPRGLATIAATPQLNWCKATPSHLELLLRLLPSQHGLQTLIVGGEAFGARLAKDLLEATPDLRIFNEYGPTEAVVGCMIHEVVADDLHLQSEVPIGRPSPGVELRIVDDFDRRVPIGSPGELCISHDGVTSGYLGTAADAEDTPFLLIDGARYYRSGDLVRLTEQSEAVYLGRKDAQVKVGGIRLDPIEVEESLNAHPMIERSAVRLWSPTATAPSKHCIRCGLPDNIPGVAFDEAQICETCHSYERVAPITQSWFRTPDDLQAKLAQVRERKTGPYDCLHLLSGGKDSTFALYKLVELGFHPYVLTLDNGFIAEGALENVRRSVAELGLDHEFATSDSMNAIFRDSLDRYSNVCHGCYKTIYTLATNRAAAIGAPLIVTGLSRGQLFETRLIPQQFSEDRFDPEAIDRAVLEARKIYHRVDDPTNRLLDTEVFADDEIFEQIEYLDFYRYVDVELSDMLQFLDDHAPWVRPPDSGRSTNCLVNAAGIHTHQTEQGYHNYAVPYAWDVRLGHKTRQEAIEELDDGLDLVEVGAMLDTIGYRPASRQILTAWIEPIAGSEDIPSPAELRSFVADVLPVHAIPSAFVQVTELPLTTNGKLDEAALPAPKRMHRPGPTLQLSATTEMERAVIETWERILRLEPIGPEDDFFALGGDSLGALEMIVALGDSLAATLPEDLAFVNTTVRTLAEAIEATMSAGDGSAMTSNPESYRTLPGEPPTLSAGELAVLFDQSTRPDDVMYNVGRIYRLATEIDVPSFQAALEKVSQHHQPLSWSYSSPRRQLTPDQAVSFHSPSVALSASDLQARIADLHREPFDLENGPLLRCLVQPMDDRSTTVAFVIHHASGDASSFPTLWRQIEQVMAGTTDLPPADYAGFSEWQAADLDDADRDYWLNASGSTEAATLAIHRPAAPEPDGFLTKVSSVSPSLLRSTTKTSAAAVSLAAVATTVAAYSDGSDVEVGLITSTRAGAETNELFGYFLNTVPVRIECGAANEPASFDQIATQAAAAIAGAFAHRAYPLAKIMADRRAEGVPQPKLDVLMAFDELGDVSILGSSAQQSVLSNGTAVAPLTFFVEVRNDRVDLSVEYRGSEIDQRTADQMLDALDRTLAERSASAGPNTEPTSVLIGPRLTDTTPVLTQISHHLLGASDHAAVVCGSQELSWSELAQRAASVAAVLVANGVEANDRVVICLPRSADLVAAIIGVQLAGAAYVPIDPAYPDDRIDLITRGAGATVGIVTSNHQALVDRPVVLTSEGLDGRSFGDDPAFAIETDGVDPSSDAYVIFTSGSTGEPRGVPVTHQMLAASTNARFDFYPAAPSRFLVPSSPAFDSSIVGLFWTLAAGGTVLLPSEDEAHDVVAIHRLATSGVSHTLMVPTLYQGLLSLPTDRPGWPDHVIVAGEACPPALAEAHFAAHPQALLTNEYGPTEATVWATAHHCAPADTVVPIGLPIAGTWVAVVDDFDRLRPSNVEGHLIIGGLGIVDGYLDNEDATAAKFSAMPAATTSTTPAPGERFFRTGDRAVVANGELRFLGRSDTQLNIGGTRAEPEDIEDALLTVEGVHAAVALAADTRPLDELLSSLPTPVVSAAMEASWNADDPAAALLASLRSSGSPQLQLVVHIEAPTRIEDAALRDELRAAAKASLPPLMRPTRYEIHRDLPRTPNGKLDRQGVSAIPLSQRPLSQRPLSQHSPSRQDVVAAAQASSDNENQAFVSALTGLFASTLHTDDFGPDDSFFDHGGHSLLAMELLLEIEEAFEHRIPASVLYESPTPRELAAAIDGPKNNQTRSFLVPIQPNGSKPPIFAIHVLGVDCAFFRPLSARLGDDQPMFGLGQPTTDLDTVGPTAVSAVAEVYANEIQRVTPDGPIGLVAISLGSVVAYELAQQLVARGRDVSILALFDALGPDAITNGPSGALRLSAHLQRLVADPMRYASEQMFRQGQKLTRNRERINLAVRRRLNAPTDHQLGVRSFIEDNLSSQRNYNFEAYPGPMLVIKAEDDPLTEFYLDADVGWGRLAVAGLEVGVAPGAHLSMMEEPNVEVVAELVSRALSRAADHDTATIDDNTFERLLIDGLRSGQLPAVMARLAKQPHIGPDAARTIADGDRLFEALAASMSVEAARVCAELQARGVPATVVPVPRRLQHGAASIDVQGEPWVATQILETLDYQPVDSSSRSALIATVKARGWVDYIRRSETTSRIRLRWSHTSFGSGTKLSKITDRLAPTSKDFEVADLPTWAWPAYWPIRPFRLASQRLQSGLRTAGIADGSRPTDLGIFLGTPTGLIEPLLHFAGVTANDLVIDIGCGDGRVLIGAVSAFGCRARGYEIDADLVVQAREAVTAAGFDDRIEIVHGDATGASHSDADVVFAFLPPEAVASILEPTLDQLPPTAVFLSHEQLKADLPSAPDRTKLIIGLPDDRPETGGITVANLWYGRRRD